MNNKNELLTVKQVAETVGVTQQYIYKQLNNKFKNYLIIIDGKKYLNTLVLNEFIQPVEQQLNQQNNKVEQPVEKQKDDLSNIIETLNKTIEILQNQLSVKDEQIKDLNNRLDQALQNQSQDNYIMAHQSKLINDKSSSSSNEGYEKNIKTHWWRRKK
jgi:predicted RNase H-like nuclease (RuvC/YqgF family)